jgi:WD40 repeat protein
MIEPPPSERWCAALAAVCVLICVSTGARARPRVDERRPAEFDDAVFSFAFSPDGCSLAIGRGSPDYSRRYGRIEIRDTETGALRRVIKGFDGPVWSVAFAPDGRTLISGSCEVRETKLRPSSRDFRLFAELKWWNPETGELERRRTIEAANPQAFMVACSPDGGLLASAEYSTVNNFLTTEPRGGTFAATLTRSMNARLLDARTGEVRSDLKKGLKRYERGGPRGVFNTFATAVGSPSRLPLFSYSTMGVIFSPDGRRIAGGTLDEIRLWDARSGEELRTFKDFRGFLRAVAFSPDGRTLAAASVTHARRNTRGSVVVSSESEIRLYDLETGKLTRTVAGRGDEITSLAFTPDGSVLVIGSVGNAPDGAFGYLRRMDLRTGSIVSRRSAALPVYSLVPSPDGRWLAVRSGIFSVALVDTGSWRVAHTFDERTGGDTAKAVSRSLLSVGRVPSLAFFPDGAALVGAIDRSALRVWDPRTGEAKPQLEGHDEAMSAVAVSPDGKLLASGSEDGALWIWDTATGDRRRIVAPGAGHVMSLAFAADAKTLAVAAGSDVTIWDAATGELERTLAGHGGRVNGVAFAPDGTTLASAGDDGTIRIWAAGTGAPVTTIDGSERAIVAVSFAPDGLTLASAGDAGTVNLWSARTWELRKKLRKHTGRVNALAFSRDGELLASGGDDRLAIIWDARTGRPKHTLEKHDVTVAAIAFSPDGATIACGTGVASAVIWDVRTGRLERTLR